MKDAMTICYAGLYRPVAPRDKVYFSGLRNCGVKAVECVDNAPGFAKFFNLAGKIRALKGQYDALWVGYASTILVPWMRLLTRKRIIWNAGNSWYETAVLDRMTHRPFSLAAFAIWIVDFLAFHSADLIIIESAAQKRYVSKQFWVKEGKLAVVYTGADETVFHPDPTVAKNKTFTVIFRGMFLPATGVEFVIEAARILKNEDINFRLIGWGEPLQTKIRKMIADYDLTKVSLTTVFMPAEELRRTMLSAHVMLGAFGNHERLSRTIQHKTFEALALGMPYITRDSESNRELLTDGVNVCFVPAADPEALAKTIMELKNDAALRAGLGEAARLLHEKKLTSEVLAAQAKTLLDKIFD